MGTKSEVQRQSKIIDFFNPEKYLPVQDALSSHLTIADFLQLCRVTKGLAELKDSMLRKFSNVNSRLRAFVNDAVSFRSSLGKNEGLIWGAFALDFFELSDRKTLCLDVVIKNGANADDFTSYMQDNEEYQLDSAEPETASKHDIFINQKRPGVTVRLTRSNGPPIQHILSSSNTTARFNFLSWNKAYSIFPQQTLIQHRLHPLRALDNDFGSELSELSTQGWTTRDIVWPDLAKEKSDKLLGHRRIGDDSTLIIPLNTDGVLEPPVPNSAIEYAQFEISKTKAADGQSNSRPQSTGLGQTHSYRPWTSEASEPKCVFLQIEANLLSSPALRYEYTTAETGCSGYVKKLLKRWAWLEWYKLDPSNRPIQSRQSRPLESELSLPQEFEMPQSWDYADDQIPRWYREWEQSGKDLGSGR